MSIFFSDIQKKKKKIIYLHHKLGAKLDYVFTKKIRFFKKFMNVIVNVRFDSMDSIMNDDDDAQAFY